MKKKINIDWDEVHSAIKMNSDEYHAVIDLETGRVQWYSDWEDTEPEEGFLSHDELEENPDRYSEIEPPESWDSFEWMEQFAANVEKERIRDALFESLKKKSRFEDSRTLWPNSPACLSSGSHLRRRGSLNICRTGRKTCRWKFSICRRG